ncbi:MAG: VOC family protein [Acidobacteriota bacterium]|nr:VOC family protein [Acidobacteriota bacterium]
MEQQRQAITPSLTVHDADAAIAFYQQAFGATSASPVSRGTDGKVMHAELLLGGMKFFLNDEFPPMQCFSPKHYGGSSVHLQMVVADCDPVYHAAMAAGATSLMEPNDAFWGDRYACVTDPFGHTWGISSVLEVLSEEEQKRRGEEFMRQNQCGTASK